MQGSEDTKIQRITECGSTKEKRKTLGNEKNRRLIKTR